MYTMFVYIFVFDTEIYPALARDYADLGKRLHKVHYEAHHEEILARKCDNTLKWVIQHQTFIN